MKQFFNSAFIKAIIIIFAMGYIIFVLWRDGHGLKDAFKIYTDFGSQYFLVLPLLLLLMWVNWSLEALKWKNLLTNLERISYSKALKTVLSGLSLGFVSPHAVGDYLAKIWSISKNDRIASISLILLGRLSQLIPTFLAGMFAIYFFLPEIFPKLKLGIYIGFFALLLAAIVLFMAVKLIKPVKTKIVYSFHLLMKLSRKQVMVIQLLAILRFAVFSFQFFILLKIAQLPLADTVIWAGIFWVFMAKSVLPSFNFLSDIGLREFSAILFFEQYDVNLSIIIAASLILWLINILIPAILGLFFIRELKLKIN